MGRFVLGINLGFATNRFPEPEVWAHIVADELGLGTVQLVADLLNPFWGSETIEAELQRIKAAVVSNNLTIHSLMTSSFTRANHFMHPNEEHRRTWKAWFRHLAELGARLGARAVGSHFGILSVRDAADPVRCRERTEEAIRCWQELSFHARDVGLEYLFFETMSIPREMAHTIADAGRLLARVNERAGVPVRLCLDVGHAPHPAERDPYLWLAELGRYAPVVHLQQTEAGHSRHWPFTPERNAIGIIEAPRVLRALVDGGASDVLLAFEIAHRESYEQDGRVVADLKASVAYWRQYLPADGVWPEPSPPVPATAAHDVPG